MRAIEDEDYCNEDLESLFFMIKSSGVERDEF